MRSPYTTCYHLVPYPYLKPFVSTCWFIRGAPGEVPLEALQLFDDMKSKQLEVAPPKSGGVGKVRFEALPGCAAAV